MGGEKVVAAKDDKKNSGQLKQEQKLDNSDKGNPHEDLIKKVATAATDAASDAAAQVMVDHLSGKEVQPSTPANPEAPATPSQVVSSSDESQTPAQPEPATPEVKEEPTVQEVSSVKSSKLTFDASKGKWVVEHPQFKSPMVFSSKEDAQRVALTLRANDVPQVEFDSEANSFEVSHKDWEEPVTVTTPDEAKSVVASKLVTLGSSEAEAQAEATAIVDEAVKPEEETKPEGAVEGSVQVQAGDVKQDTKGGVDKDFVTGMPPGAAEKKSGPKGQFPEIPGRAVTIPTPPQAQFGSGAGDKGASLKTQHGGDYASLAKQALTEVKKMQSKNGLYKEQIKMASTEEGMAFLTKLFTVAARVGVKKLADAVDDVDKDNPAPAPAEPAAAPAEPAAAPAEPAPAETPAATPAEPAA